MIYALALWNFVVFLLYGVDKYRAKRDMWRIKEKTLLLSAFLMGGAGAFFGMSLFRHKTKHIKFKILVPLFFAADIAILAFVYKNFPCT